MSGLIRKVNGISTLQGVSIAALGLTVAYVGGRLQKAYAEGRAGVPATNPHTDGSPAFDAYVLGDLLKADPDFQLATAVP